MKIQCEREKLLHAFQTAASVAPSRSPKPILQNLKLEVSDGKGILMGTDLEVGIRIEVEGITVDAPGSVVLPITRFLSILRECTDEVLVVDSDGRKIRVCGQRSEFNLPSENPDEFPAGCRFRRSPLPRVAGAVLPRDRPPHGVRHGHGEQPLRFRRRAAGTDRGPHHRRGHRRPPARPAGRPGEDGRRVGLRRPHDDRAHTRDAASGPRLGRRRRSLAAFRPRERRARQERADRDVLAVGGRPLSQVARRFPRRETRSGSKSPSARSSPLSARRPSSPATSAAASTSPSATARSCWPPTALNMASRTSSCRSPTKGRKWSSRWTRATSSDFLRVLNPEAMLVLEIRDAESARGVLDGRRICLRDHAAG